MSTGKVMNVLSKMDEQNVVEDDINTVLKTCSVLYSQIADISLQILY